MRKAIVAMLVVMLLSAGQVFAQRLTGGLTVQVTDPSGKAVSEVRAAILSKDRGNKLEVMSNEQGVIVVPDLAVGEYEVTLQHEGFRTVTANLTVRVGVNTSIDMRLELGAVASTVTVEVNQITVDTDKSVVQNTVQSKEIEQLPLNGRNFLDLAQLAPGVQVVDGGSFDPTKNQFTGVSVGGRSGRSTRIQVDGVDITDETVGTTVMNITNESIDEFGISQSSLDVSTDLTSTGAVNILTKSGTNTFHGSGFGYWRRSEFAANNGPLDIENPDKPPFSRDNYGGNLGGPLVKNKLFAFLAYERQKQQGAITASVPNAVFPDFVGSYGAPEDEHMANARLDYNLTNNQHLFYKYTHDDNFGVTGFGGVGFSAFANKNSANAHVIGWDYTKGSWTNTIRGSFVKFVNGIVDANSAAGTPQPPQPVQINVTGLGGFVYGPNANAPQATFQQNKQIKYDASWTHGKHTIQFGVAYNRIDEAGFASFFGLGPRLSSPLSQGVATVPYNSLGAADPLNYKFSFALIGNGLGYGSETPVLGLPAGGFINNRLGVYLHDTWRVSHNLTFNGGLRYDLDTGLSNHDLDRAPGIGAFDPELGGRPRNDNFRLAPQAGFAWNVNGDGKTIIRGGGGIYYETNIFNNILFDRTVNLPPGLGNATPQVGVGGSAFLISPIDGSSIWNPTTDCPNVQPGTSTPNSCIGAALGNVIPFVVAAENTFIAQSAQLAANWPAPNSPLQFDIDKGVVSGSILDPNYKSPYGAQINIGVQRQIKPGLVLSADYVLNRGVHFLTTVDRNRVGAANTLNVGLAQAAISRTLGDCGVVSIAASLINCPNFQDPAQPGLLVPATIDDYANEGLSGSGPGYDGYAFGGSNINYRNMFVSEPVGVSRYQGLQVALTGKVGTWGPFRNVTTNVAYALSRFSASAGDQDFLSSAVNNDNPSQFYGPSGEDRLHNLAVSMIMDLPAHFRLATTSYFRTNQPSDVLLQANGTLADVFTSDLNGDGTTGDPLPGTNRGSFDRGVSVTGLNQLISNFNNTFTGQLTPAGQALVDAGLFTSDQLKGLGGVVTGYQTDPDTNIILKDPVTGFALPAGLSTVPTNQKNNPLFYTTDVRLSWIWRFHERFSIEPSVDCFNIFNKTNTEGPLEGLLSGGDGSISGTTSYFTRVGAGSGSFSSGQPRAFQFGIRVSF
ncbi:MAG TPA: TonB-dependent receptor [Candidatus Saccharimonadales bacterium]|nr:TonB-dependent receptor [Candidatus Saccharimonadales bacterium]